MKTFSMLILWVLLVVPGCCTTQQPSPALSTFGYTHSCVVTNATYSLHVGQKEDHTTVLIFNGNRPLLDSTIYSNGKKEDSFFLRSPSEFINCVDEDGDGIIDFLSFDVVDKVDKTSVKHFRDTNADGQWDIMLDLAHHKRYLWLESQWLEWPKQDYVLKDGEKYQVVQTNRIWRLGGRMSE